MLFTELQEKVGIPVIYRQATMGDVRKHISPKYYEYLALFLAGDAKRVGIRLMGINEAGKTYIACAMLNCCIKQRVPCYYTSLRNLTNLFAASDFSIPREVKHSQILVIDEVGKVSNALNIEVLETVFKYRVETGLRAIIISNATMEVLDKNLYGKTFAGDLEANTELFYFNEKYEEATSGVKKR